jgi:8-oxo-dGTP diphosphatase
MSITLRNMASITVMDRDRVLLLYRQSRLFNSPKWIPTAGGHFERDEISEPSKCLWREVKEEIGLSEDAFRDVSLRYIASTLRGNELRYNYYYFGKFADSVPETLVSNEGDLAWHDLSELGTLTMPDSFRACLDHFVRIGKNNDILYSASGYLDGSELRYAINELTVTVSEVQ